MKRITLAFIISFLTIGSIKAQDHWSMNSYDYADARPFIGKVQINGELQSTTNIEIAAFVGEQVRAVRHLVEISPEKLPGQYFVWFNIKYNNSGETVTFKIYDHASGNEYANYTATVSGNPVTIVTGMDNPGTPSVPVMINFVTPQTFEKPITAYTPGSNDHYYLIASPIGEVSPEYVTNMLSINYDLYRFNQSAAANDQGITLEWENYKQEGNNYHFNLEAGKGYLYANDHDVTLQFVGTPYNGSGEVALTKTDNVDWSGWNLIGNPFGTDAALNMPFIRLSEGAYNEVNTENQTVNVMEGVFVQATENEQNANFTPVRGGESTSIAKLNISVVASTSSATALDNAIVRFDGGATLGKFQLNPNHTKVYIPQEGKDYAIVRSAAQGELPLNFKAEKDGTYTLSFSNEEVTFSYLHLIDNMTGADVDLLAGASTLRQAQGSATYTFEAKTTDYASRFRLVFNSSDANEAVCEPSFAYFNGSNWTVSATGSGAATLQVIDMMGRVLSSETISGNTEININQPAGVYMLRLIDNENVRVQKVVVR